MYKKNPMIGKQAGEGKFHLLSFGENQEEEGLSPVVSRIRRKGEEINKDLLVKFS
jgi:hypothetical protein